MRGKSLLFAFLLISTFTFVAVPTASAGEGCGQHICCGWPDPDPNSPKIEQDAVVLVDDVIIFTCFTLDRL